MSLKTTNCECLHGEAYIDANGNCRCSSVDPNVIVIPNQRPIMNATAPPRAPMTTTVDLTNFSLIEWIKGNKWLVIGGVATLVALFVVFKGGLFSDDK